MESLLQDLRYAARVLRKSPGFTAVAVLTLALAIGATTAIFSVVYGVLLRPLPFVEPDRIVAIHEVNTKGTWSRLADPNFDDFHDQSHSFEAIAKYNWMTLPVSGASQPTRSVVASVSPEFLKVFRVQPIIGRGLNDEDAKEGAAPVVLLSNGYWKQYLNSSTDLPSLHLKINNAVFSVIGVLPDGFDFPRQAALWIPAHVESPSRTSHNFYGVGRLRDGVSVEQARGDISTIARRIHDSASDKNDYLLKDATVVPLQQSMTGKARSALLILLGAVAFLLLVACANVANLMLAQASARTRELAIRSALGATQGRLVRQYLTEAFLLALAGGGLGVLAAFAGVAALVSLAPQNLPRLESVSIDVPVLVFALLLSTAVAVGLGAFTALRATSMSVRAGLGEGGREQAGAQGSQRAGRIIVAAQIAITLVLVVGAGLLGRSLMKVLEVNPGFRVDKIVTMDVTLPWVQSNDQKGKTDQAIFFSNLIGRLKRIPGVRNVGATSGLPLDGSLPDGMFLLMSQNEVPKSFDGFETFLRQKERIGNADFCIASGDYFNILGIPLVRGRYFNDGDGPDSSHVAVISESLARERWPGQDPIGHTIEFGNMDGDLRLLTIVGIVGDIHEDGLDAPPRPTVYVDLFQRPRPAITVTMLTDADTQMVTSAARAILHDLNPEIPPRFRTFAQVYSASLGSRRFNLILIAFFGAVALLLAVAGVFGVMAYSVSRRTREIGSARGRGSYLSRCGGDDRPPGLAHGAHRHCHRAGRLAGAHPHAAVAAVWRDRNRSADLRWSNCAVSRCCAAGLLHPSAEGDEGRSGGGAEERVITQFPKD